jgi:hypothetical protein
MNTDKSKEGMALVHAWKTDSTYIGIELVSARKESRVVSRGRIVTIGDHSIVLVAGPWETTIDLRGAVFVNVGSKALFLEMNLDPDQYDESVELLLGNMDRLTIDRTVSLPLVSNLAGRMGG